MITFVTDVLGQHEPEILKPVANEALVIRSLDGEVIYSTRAPVGGWTHPALMQLSAEIELITYRGAEAYIGDQWVGGTEV